MGACTIAIIRKGVTIQQIEKAISEKYTEVKVSPSSVDVMFISFKDDENRKMMLYVSFNNSCSRDYNINGIYLSLAKLQNSVKILKYMCETFGGYLKENDCDENELFYSINFDLYSKGTDFSPKDLFIHELISKLGYNNLNLALKLFKDYQEVMHVEPLPNN